MHSSTPIMSASERQEFCVRWNSHLGSIGAAFPQLLAGQRFVDVTLACEGHQVHCHRLVLAACSSYFESILAENPCKHPVIILPSEIKLWEIQALVDFMYKGEVNVTQAGLPQLLRCAEQLRIRGLYGSDAALNLNQLKALTSKPVATTVPGTLGELRIGGGGAANDSTETDDTGTNSTTTTTTAATAASALQQMQCSGGAIVGMGLEHHHVLVKKEPQQNLHQANGDGNTVNNNSNTISPQNHRHQHQLRAQHKQEMLLQQQSQASNNSNVPTDESAEEDSTSNTFDQYDNFAQVRAAATAEAATSAGKTTTHMHTHLDSTFEEDHNYVAAHDDDSFGVDNEHETTGQTMDTSGSFKRVRRSEASLAQAAKCVSKGQTFQTVSNMFNIPVSTIRFYMARKGILPKRKRGRGASSSATVTSTFTTSAIMTQALAQMKRSSSPTLDNAPPFHLVSGEGLVDAASVANVGYGYKRNEKGTLHMI